MKSALRGTCQLLTWAHVGRAVVDNQHWIVNYRVECIGVARRHIHVSFLPCRRRHHVGKEYRAKRGRELRTEPCSIPAVRGQTEEERSTQYQEKKSWNECCHRCEEKKLINGKGSTIRGLIVNPMESA